MHILIAPNAFKHSLKAAAVADAMARGLGRSRLDCTIESFPVGDGGDGTGTLLTRKLGGRFLRTEVMDPLYRPITACFGLIDDGNTAVIEMAEASGLHRLERHEYDPLAACSYGTGELICAALDAGAREFIICIGG